MADKERADVRRAQCVGGPYDTPGHRSKKHNTMTFFGHGTKPELPLVVPITAAGGLYRLVGDKYHWEVVQREG